MKGPSGRVGQEEQEEFNLERLSEHRKKNEFQKDNHSHRVVKLKEAEREFRGQIQRKRSRSLPS